MYEIPKFLIEKLIKQYGEELTTEILEGYKIDRYTTFRVNTTKSTNEEIITILEENNIEYERVDWYDSAFVLKNVDEKIIKELDIFKEGKIYLQSLSSMTSPVVLEPKPNETILDMAASPGGKTTEMANLSDNKAMITAVEKNKIRLERLKHNIEVQGSKKINIIKNDARYLNEFFRFDKILLDAPCSGSGTLNVNNDNIKYFTEELIERSQKTQLELIKKAVMHTEKNGIITYSTCSILEEENENIVKEILSLGEVELIPITDKLTSIPKLPTKIDGVITIKPTKYYEGFFIAKFRKK